MELLLMFLLLLSSSFSFASPTTSTFTTVPRNETDMLSLIAFKKRVTRDPSAALSSWNDTNHVCNWHGVTCGSRKHPGRVTTLDLSSLGLAGFISASIANLTFLRNLTLAHNGFQGIIPPELGRLRRLQVVNLRFNSFHGPIPINLTYCSGLMTLNLASNIALSGKIPVELGSLSKLGYLGLRNNSFTGSLPPSIGNLSALYVLDLGGNHLEGSIPREIGNLYRLRYFEVSVNKLSGRVPSTLFNLSSLNIFNLAVNQLEGSLPSTMGTTLPNLQEIYFGLNQFKGPIPFSLSNASRLSFVDMSRNNLNGMVPPNLGRLATLSNLKLGFNQLTSNSQSWEFLTSLANCSQLSMLSLFSNNLSGELPKSIGNLSTHLQELRLADNSISGSIPSEIGNLVNLTILQLGQNILTGVIPKSIENLQRLQLLGLNENRINGNVPSFLGNLTELIYLGLHVNNLDGPIPPNLGNLQRLEELHLYNNNFSGTIPKEIFHLASIRACTLSSNSLVGSIPFDVSSMQSLAYLALDQNKLTGEIPSTLGDCQLLEILDFHQNIFSGSIPPSFSNLKGLQWLDLSQNNMTGPIPFFLQNFYLANLNLSFNHFEGEVPMKGIFKNTSATTLKGNDKLCGGIQEFHLPPCPSKVSERRRISTSIKIVIAIASGLLCLLLCTTIVCIYQKIRSRTEKPPLTSSEDQYLRATYFDLAKATDGFSNANLIGRGAHGSVYKGVLGHEETIVAVKVFNLEQQGALKSFKDECEALRNIRHRNLNRILTSCSTIDSKGNDFKALVFEYMPNGNLDTWLHSTRNGHDRFETKSLSLIQRLNIAVNVSDALDYLHHGCQAPIIHCDLKPSNILLDDNMVAHVGDFGLARLLPEMGKPLKDPSCSIGIRGTIGYVAPEYGAGGQTSTFGDVYSFGILLLEMFTGKRPTDDMFRDGHNLHKFVEMAYPGRITEIMDPLLLLQEQDSEDLESSSRTRIQECITSVLHVGLLCSKESPKERANIRSVATDMHAIRNLFVGGSAYRE